jgi:hypothetical protein
MKSSQKPPKTKTPKCQAVLSDVSASLIQGRPVRAKNEDDTPTLTPSLCYPAPVTERTVCGGGSAACGVGGGQKVE